MKRPTRFNPNQFGKNTGIEKKWRQQDDAHVREVQLAEQEHQKQVKINAEEARKHREETKRKERKARGCQKHEDCRACPELAQACKKSNILKEESNGN